MAEKKQSASLRARVEELLSAIDILILDVDTDFHYAGLLANLEAADTSINPNDLLIAANARSLDLILVSANIKEVSRIPELSVENWLE